MTKLLCFDMDGVIFQPKNFWLELHKVFGTLKEGKQLTDKYLHKDYDALAKEVVGRLWKGKDAKPYYNLVNSTSYIFGVKEVFQEIKKRGYSTAIISSGSIDLARRAQQDLGIDYIYANELVIKDGKVTGQFNGAIEKGGPKKAEIIQHLCLKLVIKPKDVIYVGDSDTDIEAFKFVGKSIAFNSTSKKLKKVATHVVEGKDLREIITLIP